MLKLIKAGIRLVSCAALLFLGVVSCTSEEREEVMTQPQSYLDLVDAYNSDWQYYGMTFLSSVTKVFYVGHNIIVPNDEMVIDDCRKAEPKVVEFSEGVGYWYVGGEATKLKKSAGTPKESMPVYAWMDAKGFYIQASNGDLLTFDNINYSEDDPDGPDDPDDPDGPDDPDPVKPSPVYDIPKVYITTTNGKKPEGKTEYIGGTIKVVDPSCKFADVVEFEAPMAIKGRGNTTWGMPKKPYKIKLSEKAKILGMPKDKEWVLLANYDDKTLLRNIVAMEISKRLGFSWTPGMVSVEMYFNGSYEGVYTFTEHKKVSKHRVNITVATPEDNTGEGLTGGFYLEFENESINEPYYFTTQRYGVTLMCHEPEEPTAEQRAYLEDYFRKFEDTLNALGHDDRGEKNYYDYIDVNSFVNYYILEELAKDPDANFRKSTYITKDRGKKLELYHVWDFDITFGNCNYWGNWENKTTQQLAEDFVLKGCVWNNRLFGKNDEQWIKAVKARWNAMYSQLETIPDFIDEQVILLNGSYNKNFERWPILGQYVWPNAVWYSTYDDEINYLIDFYTRRLEWLNREINNL